ncbi:hypothetical protein SDC9_182046 [bioreactor metagenome]|uniref:Uncharacterized protein n=1 Tax=bioreactor metagenome TaxID=1076179 RepID=A0A645H857_9ZZZZ
MELLYLQDPFAQLHVAVHRRKIVLQRIHEAVIDRKRNVVGVERLREGRFVLAAFGVKL